jgi:hypothetical protein
MARQTELLNQLIQA